MSRLSTSSFTRGKKSLVNAELIKKTLFDTSSFIAERDKAQEKMIVLVQMIQACIVENTRTAQDQDKYQKHYNGLAKRYEAIKNHYDELVYEIKQKDARCEKMQQFIKVLKEQDGIITEFDKALWSSTVDFMTIGRNKHSVTFKDGTEIKV